jgi:hypothetical protein
MKIAAVVFILCCPLSVLADSASYGGEFTRRTREMDRAYQNIMQELEASRNRYTKAVDSWVGADANELLSSWGAPTQQHTMPNGNVIYSWVKTESRSDSASVVSDGVGGFLVKGGGVTQYSCATQFFVNRLKRVYSWKLEGNNCRL